MTSSSRRNFSLGLLAFGGTAACSNGIGSNNAPEIDARVDATLSTMFETYPDAQQLAEKAAGMLVIPLMTEAGFGLGGGFGRGALRVGDANVDYYSAASASAGLQIGAQQYSHVLFFMTENALLDFRASQGWAVGVNVEYVFRDQGDSINADTTTTLSPVVAVVFAQVGLRLGATLDGIKYTRIIP
jgi:lipid-binding SYLF domain-containing protein